MQRKAFEERALVCLRLKAIYSLPCLVGLHISEGGYSILHILFRQNSVRLETYGGSVYALSDAEGMPASEVLLHVAGLCKLIMLTK